MTRLGLGLGLLFFAAGLLQAEERSARVSFDKNGLSFGTFDRQTEVRLRAVLQIDGRLFFATSTPIGNVMLIRRARPILEGTLFGIVDFRLMPDFAPGQALLQDGYVELHGWPFIRLRVGKFKSPLGLELLESDTTLPLLERSLASNLVPVRDLGVMFHGDIADGALRYAVALLEGAADGATIPDAAAPLGEFVGRFFVQPLHPVEIAALRQLGFGFAGSYARPSGAQAPLPIYRSPGQQPLFSYLTGAALPLDNVVAAGERWRIVPQAHWYVGPLGVIGEYMMSAERVERQGRVANLKHQGWNVSASFMLTLEAASPEGPTIRRPVDFRRPYAGAFELALRYSELRLDAATFPLFADAALAVAAARELAIGLNWHLTQHAKIMASFHRTDFVRGGSVRPDRDPENALMFRLQLAL